MEWREFPYWSKGGIIAIGIVLLIFILSSTVQNNTLSIPLFFILVFITIIIQFLFPSSFCSVIDGCYGKGSFLVWPLTIILIFFIGAIIGIIIKSFKKN